MTLDKINFKNLGIWTYVTFLILCPIFLYHGEKVGGAASSRIGQEQFFQVGITVLFSLFFIENIYVSLFILLTVFGYAFHNFSPLAGHYLINIFFAGLLYQITYKLVNRENLSRFYWSLMVLLVLNLTMLALQTFWLDFIYISNNPTPFHSDYVGMMGIKAHLGIYIASMIPFLAIINPILSILMLIPMKITDCSSAVLGGICGYLFILWFWSRKMFYVLVGILVVAGGTYFYFDNKSGNMMIDRPLLWKFVLRDSMKHPMIGWGPDSFRQLDNEKNFLYMMNARTHESFACKIDQKTGAAIPPQGTNKEGDSWNPWDHPHNEYVSLLFEYGILGVLLLLALIRDIKRRFDKSNRIHVVIVAYFIVMAISSIGQFPFHVIRLGYLFPIILAVYYKLTDKEGVLDGKL